MTEKKAFIIVNTGSPECNIPSIKTFLKLFLSDKHVIRMPKVFWYPILYGIILRKRPVILLKKYQEIAINGTAPLLFYEKQLTKKLQMLDGMHNIRFFYANMYSRPYIEDILQICINENISDIKVLPLFAQYSGVTTKAVIDKFRKHDIDNYKLSFITEFYTNPLYIKALLNKLDFKHINADTPLLLAYHSLPQSYIKKENLYIKHCINTSKLIDEAIGRRCPVYTVFVSKFGKGKWLKPSLTDILQKLKNQNVKTVNLMSPGFMLDCLETIYDVKRAAFTFCKNEDMKVNYLPCLNDSNECVEFIATLIKQ